MTGFGRAEAQQVVAAQFIERAQQMVLIAQPPFVLGDDGCAIAAIPIRNGLPHLLPRPM